ncbi:MAG: TonB-dependent receptor plug domain-containing protein [Prevotellaceae bacterium]|jgi:TonB-dependent SusC/RagA subfamily outer membrane receptor|nr:TonB-dependent receptor plug domain-containing protein [Prevotellaceae bacterium]
MKITTKHLLLISVFSVIWTGMSAGTTQQDTITVTSVGSIQKSDPLIRINNLEGVKFFLDGNEIFDIQSIDPNSIESVSVLKDKTAVKLYGEDASNGVVLITTKKNEKNTSETNESFRVVNVRSVPKSASIIRIIDKKKVKFLLDGIEISDYKSVDPNTVESISVLKDKTAIDLYGEGASNGVVLITTKKTSTTPL